MGPPEHQHLYRAPETEPHRLGRIWFVSWGNMISTMRATWNPNESNFDSRPSCQTQSKALEKFSETDLRMEPIECGMTAGTLPLESSDRTSYWWSISKPKRSRNKRKQPEITVSKTFGGLSVRDGKTAVEVSRVPMFHRKNNCNLSWRGKSVSIKRRKKME